MTRIISRLADLHGQYDALFCDVWGCVHDGVRAFPDAADALVAFREAGGRVILLTNAPRPWAVIAAQLDDMGVPRSAWDAITTSGDSARALMFGGAVGARVWHVGEPRDYGFFEPMEIIENPVAVERVDLDAAEGIVCTGPFDPHADPEVMRPDLERAAERGLPFLCANPDIVVDRGDRREWCAGAIARLYTAVGGRTRYVGKPHAPVYDLATRRLVAAGGRAEDRILAVGDGLPTDVTGALDRGLDCLFVTGGLAAEETRTEVDPDPDALAAVLGDAGLAPSNAIGYLR